MKKILKFKNKKYPLRLIKYWAHYQRRYGCCPLFGDLNINRAIDAWEDKIIRAQTRRT